MKRRPIHIPVILTFILAMTSGCSQNSENEESTASSGMPGVFTLSRDQLASSSLNIGPMQKKDFHKVIKATGMIDVPPQNRVSVSVYFGGYVKDINLLPGHEIRKGQRLFTLENPEFVQVQQEFLETQGQLTFLKSDFERQKKLVEDNVTSQKKFLQAESDFNIARARYESLRKRLQLMNINPNSLTAENIRTSVIVASPLDGFITGIHVTRGKYLNPSDVAMEIVNTDDLHLELNIFEKDLSGIHEDQRVTFRVQDDPSKVYEAHVYLVNKAVDPEKRTIRIHGHLMHDTDRSKLNPGMYVEASIYADTDSSFALPQEAVVEVSDIYYVLVRQSANDSTLVFRQKKVVVGQTSDGFTEIRNAEDFDEDTQFLLNGVFELQVEAF